MKREFNSALYIKQYDQQYFANRIVMILRCVQTKIANIVGSSKPIIVRLTEPVIAIRSEINHESLWTDRSHRISPGMHRKPAQSQSPVGNRSRLTEYFGLSANEVNDVCLYESASYRMN